MRINKKLCCIAMSLTFMSSMLVTPILKVGATENGNGVVTEANGSINTSGLQADITFPDYLNYVDDTLIVNNMYTFKGYQGQGKLYITCSDGLQSVRVFINGKEIDVIEVSENNGKTYEIDFSNVSVNDRNTIQVTNFVPETGKVNIKIPYPDVTTETLYDLASNTKMYSTNYAIQKLVSDGTISISDKITKFFPEFVDGENDPIKGKANLTLQLRT